MLLCGPICDVLAIDIGTTQNIFGFSVFSISVSCSNVDYNAIFWSFDICLGLWSQIRIIVKKVKGN